MINIFNEMRDINILSVCLRLFLAMLFGGIIGMERSYKRRSAGFRTHILICMGSAITTMTSQYVSVQAGYFTDVARLGAQVVAGIGFIGAGAIIVTNRQRVKGLTTAAGLWTTAIIGLSVGAGFYEGAFLATVLLMLAEVLFIRFEKALVESSPEVNIFIEFDDNKALDSIIDLLKLSSVGISDLKITKNDDGEKPVSTLICCLEIKSGQMEPIIRSLERIKGVTRIEEV